MPYDRDNNNTGFITTIYGFIRHKALWVMRNWKWVSSPLTTVHGATLRVCVYYWVLARVHSLPHQEWFIVADGCYEISLYSSFVWACTPPGCLECRQTLHLSAATDKCSQAVTNVHRKHFRGWASLASREDLFIPVESLWFYLMYNLASNIIICFICQNCNICTNMQTSCNDD